MKAEERGVIEVGKDAFRKGIKVGDNPYSEDDARFWLWMKGWAGAGLAKMREKIAK